MRPRLTSLACLLLLVQAYAASAVEPPAGEVRIKVCAHPLHEGRINPMLFGNFIELLDDLVPGMRAEMLNDRGFDGVTRPASWVYYDGAPNICDRQWEGSGAWTYDTADVFNGPRSVKLAPAGDAVASVAQSGLAVRGGATYRFSGYFRGSGDARITVVIKTLLPDGAWSELASAELGKVSSKWTKLTVELRSKGTTDRAVFELRAAGAGTVWADKLSLMPADAEGGWRPDVVAAIKAVRPGVIRWGGSVCDPGGYRWKGGIGDRDARVPFPNKVWGRIDSNDVGIDEFCRFCELTSTEPLVCVSVADGPASAADLVQYCNGGPDTPWGAKRAANGHPRPYGVKYWQVGNEISGDDEKYLASAQAFCTAMWKADPHVRLMSSFPTERLLQSLGSRLAYICPHHYTPNLADCDADIRKLASMIRKVPGCDRVRIAVTEWNVTAGGFGLGRGPLLTLGTALLNARYLNVLCRNSDMVEIACRSNMTNSLGSGIIETSPAGLLRRPSYYAMKLYADHAKPIPLELDAGPGGLDVIACATEAKDRVCVFAVNSGKEPVTVSLELSGLGSGFAPVSAEVVCDKLDARQPDVMNHWTAPDRIETVPLRLEGKRLALPAFSIAAIECRPGE